MEEPTTVTYVPYKKGLAVFGNTKPYKEEFKKLGGKFNPSLTFNNEKNAGWYFSKEVEEDLNGLVEDINSGKIIPHEGESRRFKSQNSTPKVEYQILKYKVVKPRVGQEVTLVRGGERTRFKISSVDEHDCAVDVFTMSSEDITYNCYVVSGVWEILELDNHTILFH